MHTPRCVLALSALVEPNWAGKISIPTSVAIVWLIMLCRLLAFLSWNVELRYRSLVRSSFHPQEPRHRGDIHIKCNTENISIFLHVSM